MQISCVAADTASIRSSDCNDLFCLEIQFVLDSKWHELKVLIATVLSQFLLTTPYT